ncbi:MAG: conjugal transfer protein TraX [Oscillospiraceae bacterium]|nr:conjugal transfer protein TraX [Oscillospiraceae bacterium]
MGFYRKKGLTSSQLKIIALVIMTLDHLAKYQLLTKSPYINELMRITGRIAAPLFLFLLVEGLRHTRNRRNYIMRLYTASVIMEFLRVLAVILNMGIPMGNIFQTFFYAALYITCIDKIIKSEKFDLNIIKYIVFIFIPLILTAARDFFGLNLYENMLLNILLPPPFEVEFSFFFVLLGIAWYFVDNKNINCIILAVLSVICGVVDMRVFNNPSNNFTFWHLFTPNQWLMILAVVFIALYNGEKGAGGFKYFFYIYYPVHQVLFLIAAIILQ